MSDKKKTVVPRLRFPEFRDAGPWELRTIEDIAERIAQGGTPDTSVPEYWNGEIPWITPAEMGDDALHHYTGRTVRALSKTGLQNSSAELLPAHSVIISSRAPIGYVTINTVAMATNQGCKGIVPKQSIYHEFLYFSLLRAKQRLNDLGAGAGFKEISSSSLKTFKIPFPPRPEQQKIADCLCSLDELIELEAKRLDALKAHKKGLLQQLFPREGETTPRLRFPEFRDAGPWEVKRLGEVAQIIMGASPKSSSYNDQKLGLPLIQGNADIEGRRSSPRIFTSEITKECFPGDVLLSVRAPVGAVAKSIHHACIGRGIAALRSIKNNSQEILYQLLLYYEPKWSNVSQGGTFDSVNSKEIKLLKVYMPGASEQQKIADCLSSLDELIELQAKRLEALKAHKKGLMQQLFPQEVA